MLVPGMEAMLNNAGASVDHVGRAGEEGRRYLSGGYIAKELGITRAAVWKYIEAIRADGHRTGSTQAGLSPR